jgi:CRISPR-associated protein Csd1
VILQGLVNYYERLEDTGKVALLGYSEENISFAIVIARDGSIVDITDLRDHSSRRPRPKALLVPKPPADRSGTKRVSAFLWDNSKYALGIGRNKDGIFFTPDQVREFKLFHSEALHTATDVQLVAFRAFVEKWTSDAYASQRYAEELPEAKIVFRLDGEDCFVHETVAAQNIWQEITRKSNSEMGVCLVSGIQSRIERLHADISNVAGQRNVGPLTSFNEEAFESFGKSQGMNAPVSERAAHAYATALNRLLSLTEGIDATGRPHWMNRVQIGDATAVFWAEAAGGPDGARTAERAESLFATLLEPPTDDQEASTLRTLLQKVEEGRPLAEVDPALDSGTRFYVLGLSPNRARLSVRFFLRSTVGELVAHGVEHYRDLSIEPRAWVTPPAAWRLLLETAAQREADNISPALAGELARAILTGGRYPRSLVAQIIMRVRADGEINGLRAAIAKAYISRAHRKGIEQGSPDPEEDIPVALDRNETNPGYRLGRLFYVLENAQRLGVGRVNATIRDKFYASASANPARVFPLLLRGAQDHIGAVRRKSGGGLSFWLDEQIAEIVGGLPASIPFPSTLRLEDQGRFLVGYYHQRNAAKSEGKNAEELPDTTDEE